MAEEITRGLRKNPGEKKMKVVLINGSPRKEGNTAALLGVVTEELEKQGVGTELVQLGGKRIRGCRACYKCFENQDQRCSFKDDMLNECMEKMIQADGMVLGTPTYFSNVTSEIKALIDRAGLVAIANNYLFKQKVGAAVVAVRRAGATDAFDAINKLFLINQMIVPGSIYWNLGVGFEEGDVKGDDEGVLTMNVLAQNMAWLLKKVAD